MSGLPPRAVWGRCCLYHASHRGRAASLKPLERRGLLTVMPDAADHRSRRLMLTEPGRALLARALPAWERTQVETGRLLADPNGLRAGLRVLS